MEKILMENNPYFVEPSKRPKEAIRLAIKNGLFKKYYINKKLIKDYFNNRIYLPIKLLEAICKFNKAHIEIPVFYQNLWFCLHNVKIRRIQPSRRVIETKVKFYPVYLCDERIYSLIKKVSNMHGKDYFCHLIGVSKFAMKLWLNKKARVPISAVFKACDLLGKNIWDEIDGLKIYTKSNGNTILFKNKNSAELLDILIWVKEEGHLSLSGQIQIEQKNKQILQIIKILFINVFNLLEEHTHISDKGRGHFVLHIYSYAIRQILCLKFNIPLGYKSKISSYSLFKKVNRKEDKLRMLAKLAETEGSLTYCNKTYNFLQPKFYFGVSNNETIFFYNRLLTNLNYRFYTNSRKRKTGILYETTICNLSDASKFCYEIFPYFNHGKKIMDAINILSQNTYITRLRIKNNNKLKNLIKKAYITIDPTHNEHITKLVATLTKLGKKYDYKFNKYNIFDWLREDKERKSDVPLLAVLLLCKITNQDYFKYIPKELSFLLFLHKFIDYSILKQSRGLNYNHIINTINNGYF